MRPREMHRLAHGGCHINGPRGWRDVPVVSGDYDLDATILHRDNKDLPKRLSLYTKRSGSAYGNRTGYNSYKRYTGDD